ncbi:MULTISPECIES: N-acetylglucosamine-6-phosphate deacetylase [Actinotignum]|uniref:Amidohydrolase family protein n=3 Tax=Actinotignum timonense TaxID=1870995 RepID=A0AAW9HAM6_9ACTO|nr:MULTISPECIES: amidohydrolase family protein [Actinotignum]MBS5749183.1 amidohydrolase family protein [Actinotignum schaalii]MDE1557635.1 amidohydrolase family protein [Actinotignum schaalii]MDE1662563.1 amidohydrolase family protein [Actinotignum schaalii]MDK6373372.1 amidohydrolase family protein [Actinotignum timonense]MDK6418111.1 amidohydrolase family protein [Actinotignum timonense]
MGFLYGRAALPGGVRECDIAWDNGVFTRVAPSETRTHTTTKNDDAAPGHQAGAAAHADGGARSGAAGAAGADSGGELPEGWLILPGLVDEHCHGGGGASFPDAEDSAEVAQAAGEHLAHGTTSVAAALTTLSVERMEAGASLMADAVEDGTLAAILIEGPFLSSERAGAQNPAYLESPSVEIATRLLDAARGHAWGMTLAPELSGASEVVDLLLERGVVPTWGHTHAEAGPARELQERAVAGGAIPVATHLFNAMRELRHRAPGPVAEYLAAARRGSCVVELIGDGVHISSELVRNVVEIVGPENIALITDAMAAAGMADGTYELGGLRVHVTDGQARLRGGNLAGGTSHLLDIVRTVVGAGVELNDAVTMASATPARVMGLDDRGALEVGKRADLLVVDEELRPRRVYRAGKLVAQDGKLVA